MFGDYLTLWKLAPDGAAIFTPRAGLLPVRQDDVPAMLKVATEPEEMRGGLLMRWWDGEGAAHVLAARGPAILIEWALGERSLAHYARTGRDDEATHIICAVVDKLHSPRATPAPEGLLPLDVWFEALAPLAASEGGVLARCAAVAKALLPDQQDVRPLHGDIHHDNVLDFGLRGWRAIDPKRLVGDRGFDYANLFCNPDMEQPEPRVAVLAERFCSRLAIVTKEGQLERRRLLKWIIAYTGLSAAWCIGDGLSPAIDLRIAELALAEMNQ